LGKGFTYGTMFPGNELGLSCEILAVSINYHNNTEDDNIYKIYVANYGNASTAENFQTKEIGVLLNNTTGSVEISFPSIISLFDEEGTNRRITINPLDYFGLYITRENIKADLLQVRQNILLDPSPEPITIEPPKVMIDATIYLLQG
jgi:hypothetical protein